MKKIPMEFLSLLIGFFVLTILVHGQDQSGFISMDCGMAEGSDYNDTSTGIAYTSDGQFIDTGIIKNNSADFMSENLPKYLSRVRAFPEGLKNCYTIKVAGGNKYLIRAVFMYGNYDSKNQAPEFGLYLNADEWDLVKMENSNATIIKEIIHVQITDYLHVCLVNTGQGTPFISAMELRRLNSSMYETQTGSLALARRLDLGSTSNAIIRYKDDIYDRVWEPYRGSSAWESLSLKNTSQILRNRNYFIPPSAVMRTAVGPKNRSMPLELSYTPDDDTQQFYVYMHFAEVEDVSVNRSFSIWMNGGLFYDQYVVLNGPRPLTLYSFYAVSGTSLDFSFYPANDSTLPPILNAIEFYLLKQSMESPTQQNDVEVIMEIKSVYGIKRNWQGDPCAPKKYLWDGLECGYQGQNFSRIISLDLSSSQLSGEIDSSLSKLKSLQHLDLSNNNLTGEVPEFLTQLPLLKTLNLSGNEFTGSVPSLLLERSKNGSLTLSVDVNPNPCAMAKCKKKKESVIIPVVASIASVLVLFSAVAILWILRKTRRKDQGRVLTARADEVQNEEMESKSQQLSYSELVNITNNFRKVLGEGRSGTVYGGYLTDGTQVAVKMLSQSSQGPKEFQAEAQLMMEIHHKNLASPIGYCNEGHLGLVHEYMANGNLEEYLSTTSTDVLSWDQRLRIAVDAAEALEYLHNGCKLPTIHGDVKTSNILLDEKLQAKVTDFGLSRITMAVENGCSHIGTVGYLDPERYRLNKLNAKSDVYDFGMVLLELVTGQPATVPGNEGKDIIQWLNPVVSRGEIREVVDSRLDGDFSINSAWKVLETAMVCVAPTPRERPTMTQVVRELKESLDMDMCREESSTGNLEWKQHQDAESSSNSNDVIPLNLEFNMDPQRD